MDLLEKYSDEDIEIIRQPERSDVPTSEPHESDSSEITSGIATGLPADVSYTLVFCHLETLCSSLSSSLHLTQFGAYCPQHMGEPWFRAISPTGERRVFVKSDVFPQD